MALGITVLQIALIVLKLLSVLLALLLLLVAVGWLRGTDNVAFPGLGLIIATPLLLLALTLLMIVVLVAAMVGPALMK
jgi:hypothetical protein